MDFNGKTNAKDARLVLRYAAKLEEFSDLQIKVADADASGKTNAKDARLILRAAAKIEPLSPETIVIAG
ncbi:MAG: hypothetical protein IJL26_02815 [Clostridia bacterium]|nr:hypothetical protein [Clostridia bacterium]